MARTETDAALFGISFLGVKDIYSADNSSPQTTEINAQRRVATLMKWVNIAAVESLGLIFLLTSAAPPGHKRWPLLGGLTGLIVTYTQYLYAKDCGLRSIEPGTEDVAFTRDGRPVPAPFVGRHGPGMNPRGTTR